VDQAVLDDLRGRLRATRRAALPGGLGWERGTDPEYLAELVGYWAEAYDWRAAEERIRALPWVRVGAGRALHQRAADPDAPVVVLLHGWPDSVLRFERVLALLGDVHVVVPCLPGFPWGAPVTRPGMSRGAMAEEVERVLAELGHGRCVVSGGDIGAGVAEELALAHPGRVGALHLTDVPLSHGLGVDEAQLGEDERAYLADVRRWQAAEGGYALVQATKPHTLAAALADSPVGLAAWIVEKLRSWSDCGGDVEVAFPRDDLLTWVTAYWVTGTIGTSFSPYAEPRRPVGRVDVPTAFTIFPREPLPVPRAFGERSFDVRVWDEQPRGGHFGAWERPEAFAAGVRAAVALL
jgi:pimeloyl-ACP methyl ester carboxylesterase